VDILILLADLHKQATTERSHYYTGKVISLAITEIINLRAAANAADAAMKEKIIRYGVKLMRSKPSEIKQEVGR
jgi:hypothetical protein